ncbi:hypothetical protein [Bradyrhizobium pachyrhizi]|uniref:hypothetical protein n=1 Tax=Bradyrhizobium pachyrhizi TaxID=280333 RepID=UPI003D35B1DC
MIDPSNLPPELAEPPQDAPGWIAFQLSTAKVWRKLNGKWLPIAEAQELIRNRTSSLTSLSSYSTGTVSVAANGTIVTGAGVIWSGTNVRPGDILQVGDFQTIITDVTDESHLVIPPWGGGAQAGAAYTIWQWFPQRVAGAQAMQFVNDLVAALNTSGFFWFVDASLTAPDPSYGEDGQYAYQPTTGKQWIKVGGIWSYLGIYKGLSFRGPYDNAATYAVGDVQTTSGTSYVWINPTPGSGHPAPNATYWQVLAAQGIQGPTGATGPGYGGTSTTSLAIGTGAKAFTTQAGLAYQDGARVRATATAGATGWLEGVVTYSGTTLTITADKIFGSGTGTAWNFNVVGQPGAGDLSSANNGSDFASPKTAKDNISVHGADVASAATTNLEAATGDLVDVTGTTNINFVTLGEGHERTVRFTGVLTMTHSASLLLPGAANITTAAGDFAVFRGYASGVVRCVGYTKANGQPLLVAAKSDQIAASSAAAAVVPGVQQFHPSAAKGWVFLSMAAAIATSYNVSSITDSGTGQFTVNWTVPFATANYAIHTSLSISAASGQVTQLAIPSASGCALYVTTNAGAVSETGVVGAHIVAFGGQ